MKLKAIALATTAALVSTGGAQAQEVLEMTSAFGKNLPILGTAGVDFVEKINSISESV
jgi:TRAP-type mannitol/chloroaromatic compound transport system substrate-binding protein